LSVVKSELAYVVSIQMLYRNALDIHRKHTASCRRMCCLR